MSAVSEAASSNSGLQGNSFAEVKCILRHAKGDIVETQEMKHD